MQSENGILLLFYIFLSHGNEEKKNEKRGDAVSCPQVPVTGIYALQMTTDMLHLS
jgi:hypothetical protein